MRARFSAFAKNAVLFGLAAALLCAAWPRELLDFAFMEALYPEVYVLLRGDRRACVLVLEATRKHREVRHERAFHEQREEKFDPEQMAEAGPAIIFDETGESLWGIRVRGGLRGWGLPGPPRDLNQQMRVVRENPLIALIDRELYSFIANYEEGARIWFRTDIPYSTFGPSGVVYTLEVRGVSSRVREAIGATVTVLEEAQDQVRARWRESGARTGR